MKYAIIICGGKQYKVKEGDILEVERLNASQPKVEFDKIVALSSDTGIKLGTPYVPGAKVEANILGEVKDKKVIIFKYRRKKSSQVKKGHRQFYTQIKIEKILEA